MLNPMSTAVHPRCMYCNEKGVVKYVYVERKGEFSGIISVIVNEIADCPYYDGNGGWKCQATNA